ncbi:MAG: Na+/H+ antiporter subunit D [Phycisphaerae bacterium]|nr:Na+/H+ antiporter subunit D [Phycisphaerae bacterium]
MNALLVMPIVIPMAGAAVSLLLRGRRALQCRIGIMTMTMLLITSIALIDRVWHEGILVTQIGKWPSPFGITIIADMFSAIMVVLASIIGLATAIYAASSVDSRRQSFGFYPLLSVLLMGICGAFLTGDLFNLYVWFEVMLIASFVLLVLGGERAQMEGSIKYVTLNLMSSAVFLAAVGIVYGLTGTLNMADLAEKLNSPLVGGVHTTVAMMFLIAFGIKAGLFPLFFWLPASYHTPPAAVSAVFAGLLTKVGVYALIRVFTLLFTHDVSHTHGIITVIAGLTMVTGVLGAASQYDFRRILSFHIISQIGYMIMGLGLYTHAAITGSIFYIIHHIIVKTNLFFVSGVANRLGGSYELKRLGGLYRQYPWLALLFMVPAMSLAGMPPLSGFFAKLALIRAGLEIEQYAIVTIALVVGVLTLFSMTKIWSEAFWKPAPVPSLDAARPRVEGIGILPHGTQIDDSAPNEKTASHECHNYVTPKPLMSRANWSMLLPIAVLALVTVSIGIGAELVLKVAARAADELLNPAGYVEAVLGARS